VILSDRDLRKAQANHTIVAPFRDDHVQPASIDLRLGSKFRTEDEEVTHFETCAIYPGQFLLGHTIETITLPACYAARVEGRSSWGRLGLLIHATAGFIDPGFEGQITLELFNLSRKTIRLPIGDRVCQITLLPLTSPAEKPYGSVGLGSHYQGQTGVTASAIGEHA
jgi:dCTP deaminase